MKNIDIKNLKEWCWNNLVFDNNPNSVEDTYVVDIIKGYDGTCHDANGELLTYNQIRYKFGFEYSVACITFENEMIDGTEFDEPVYGSDYYIDYEPAPEDVKDAYGKGWEFVKKIIITKMPINAESSDEFEEIEIKVNHDDNALFEFAYQ